MTKPTSKSNLAPKARPRQKSTTVDNTKRKRELDRIAQRNCRERTKNRINFLEAKVRSLEQRDVNSQFSSLVETQETLLNESAELRAAMRKILFIAGSMVNKSENSTCEKCKLRSSDSETMGSPDDAPMQAEHRSSSAGSQDDFLDVQQETYFKTLDFAATSQPNFDLADSHPACEEIPQDNRPADNIFMENELFDDNTMAVDKMVSCNNFIESELSLIPSSSNCEPELADWQNMPFSYDVLSPFGCNNPGVLRHEEMWKFSDRAFARGLEMTRSEKMIEHNSLDSAVAVQAILWGWHTIDAKTRNHPAWVALREVDEKIFGLWKSKPQKIAMMYVCSLVMQYHSDPTPENLKRLPTWFRPRPSQERLQHPLVIDYLIWPGLREFLVFNHIAYTQTGEFSQRFTEDFHFYWPFPETSIFEFDPASCKTSFSKLFKKYAFDLSNWTMDPKFFERYPELAHDIPVNKRKPGGARMGMDFGMDNETIGIRDGKVAAFEDPGIFEILSPGQAQCWSPEV